MQIGDFTPSPDDSAFREPATETKFTSDTKIALQPHMLPSSLKRVQRKLELEGSSIPVVDV